MMTRESAYVRTPFLLAMLLSLGFYAHAVDFGVVTGKKPFFSGWTYHAGTASGIPDTDPAWKPVVVNQPVNLTADGWFTLRNEFSLEPSPTGTWFFMSKFPAPCEVRLNGTMIGYRGSFPPSYFVNIASPFTQFLPPGLLKTEGRNVLEIKGNFHGPVFIMTECFLADKNAWAFESYVSELFNSRLYLVFSVICLFAGLFLLFQFAYRTSDATNLIFAIACVFMSINFLDIGIPELLIPFEVLRPLGKSALIMGIACITDFFVVFHGIHDKPWVRVPIYTISAAFVIPLAFSLNETVLMDVFTMAMPLLAVEFAFILYVAIRAIIVKKPFAGLLLTGTVIALIFAVYDIVYRVIGLEPFAWLQGIGFFSLIAVIFIVLAIKSSEALNEQERYATILESQTKELTAANESISRFIPREFLELLGRESIIDIVLGDHAEREMAVIYSDIRGFTSLSEKMSPQENFTFLNGYFRLMVPVIREGGGIINKYLGDAIMAVFPEGAKSALETAVRLRHELAVYNDLRRAKNRPVVQAGIGIHSGKMLLGMIGEEHRMDSTILSDAITLATQIENLTKRYGSPVLVSETIVKSLGPARSSYTFKAVGKIASKGTDEDITVFSVDTDDRGEIVQVSDVSA